MKFCKPKPKSIFSLDIGTKRIGLAYCDPLCITSNILPAVKRFENNQEIKIIRNYINEFNLTGFIVGIPLDEEGQMTTQAIDCKNYGQLLSNELKLPLSYVNEHSSTWESSDRFGIKKDKSGLIDFIYLFGFIFYYCIPDKNNFLIFFFKITFFEKKI